VVEHIYIKNIGMKDIVRDAILFDMYYFTKPADNELSALPPVTEATPQFRNFYISHIVCQGAERGIFIRGLPEMPIKNIVMDNLVLKTNSCAEIIEANDIQLNQVKIRTVKTGAPISVTHSSNVNLNGNKL
jgi:hypothetical protein